MRSNGSFRESPISIEGKNYLKSNKDKNCSYSNKSFFSKHFKNLFLLEKSKIRQNQTITFIKRKHYQVRRAYKIKISLLKKKKKKKSPGRLRSVGLRS